MELNVKRTFFYFERKDSSYGTGLFFELEDGRVLRHYSTDPVMTFEFVVDPIAAGGSVGPIPFFPN